MKSDLILYLFLVCAIAVIYSCRNQQLRDVSGLVEFNELLNLGDTVTVKGSDARYKIVKRLPRKYLEHRDNKFGVIKLSRKAYAILLPGDEGFKSSWFGAKGDGTTDDTESLNLLVSFTSDPAFIEAGSYKTSNSIEIRHSKQIKGAGQDLSSIQLTTLGVPAIDILNMDSVEISDLEIKLDIIDKDLTTLGKKAFRGNRIMTAVSGIWTNGAGQYFHDLRVVNFLSGIRISPYDVLGRDINKVGNRLHNLELFDNDFGIIGSGQENLSIKKITGNYTSSIGNNAPPHVIYIAQQRSNENVVIEDVVGLPSSTPNASVISIKDTHRGHIKRVTADSCNAVLTIGGTSDFLIETIRLTRGFNQGFKMGNGSDRNITLRDVKMQFDTCDRGLFFAGENFVVQDIDVEILNQTGNKRVFLIRSNNSSYRDLTYQLDDEKNKGAIYRLFGRNNTFDSIEKKGVPNEIIDKGEDNVVKKVVQE